MRKTNGREFFGKNLSVEFAKKGGHKKDGYPTEDITSSRHEFKPDRENSFKKSPYNGGGGGGYHRGGNRYNSRKSIGRPSYNAPQGGYRRDSRSRSGSPKRYEKPRFAPGGYNKHRGGGDYHHNPSHRGGGFHNNHYNNHGPRDRDHHHKDSRDFNSGYHKPRKERSRSRSKSNDSRRKRHNYKERGTAYRRNSRSVSRSPEMDSSYVVKRVDAQYLLSLIEEGKAKMPVGIYETEVETRLRKRIAE